MKLNFSTNDIESSHRLEFWHDVVCQHCVPAACRVMNPQTFGARFTAKSLAGLEVCEMSSPEHLWERDAKHLRKGPNEDFMLSLMVSGIGHLSQSGRQVVQKPGDIVLYDAARPFTFRLAPESAVILKIPRKQLLFRVPEAENHTAIRLAEGQSIATLLGSVIKEASQINLSDDMQTAQSRFASSLLDLLGATLQLQTAGAGATSSAHSALFQRAKDYIEVHLDDPTIDVEQIAASQMVSSRTLTRVFATNGSTPMRWLWQRRLEASYCALTEGGSRHVTEVAFQFGFSDVSHFSHVFKKTYGVTPISLRRNKQ